MKKHLHALALSVSFFTAATLGAQQEVQKWYFGANAGLDFSTSPPTVLTNGALNTSEGCASICNANGNLLFYTDGSTVYNSNHATMSNGTGLMGDPSTTQSAMIVKQPGSNTSYYVFTLAAINATPGLRYSVVDLSLAAGLGSVTVKNTPLYTPSTEKMVAVRHCNGTDTWVITHDHLTDVFRTFLVTSTGISPSPVLSSLGPTMTAGYTAAGQLKISPNGRKLGMVITNFNTNVGSAHMFDFDPATGIVSNGLLLTGGVDMYGCEFSPDGTKFYAGDLGSAGTSTLRQWDLCAGNNTAILGSLSNISTSTLTLASFQLGPDKKIYIAIAGTQQLAVINNPDAVGNACNYVSMGISTAPKTVNLGLPNFISSFFKSVPAAFTTSTSCTNGSFTATQVNSPACSAANFPLSGIQWNFGDPASGSNSASGSTSNHTFSGPGTYTVKCIYNYQCSSDTVKVPVVISGVPPTVSVAATRSVICQGENTILTASGASFYQWGNGPATNTAAVSPTATTVFTVAGTDAATQCEGKKQFTVTVNKCTGIGAYSAALEFGLFPNPMARELKLLTNEKSDLSVYDQTGALLYEAQVNAGTTELDMSFLEPGIYFVKLSSGRKQQYKRLVKTE